SLFFCLLLVIFFHLHSFPTRRSSDLLFHINLLQEYLAFFPELVWLNPEEERINIPGTLLPTNWTYRFRPYIEELTTHVGLAQTRSEEHTSELQSPCNLVCRLLLEKKK